MVANLLSTLLLVIFFYGGGECARMIGCYRENTIEAPIMTGDHQYYPDILTPQLCIDYCSTRMFSYAGIRNMIECMCSDDRPSYEFVTEMDKCDSKCNGNYNEICGGNLKIIVYELKEQTTNHVQQRYLGCYVDSGKRTLDGKFEMNIPNLTPERCVAFCYRHGYRFAGVQFSKECFCGNTLPAAKAPETDCNRKCSGYDNFLCGGPMRNGVYFTQKNSPLKELLQKNRTVTGE